MPELYKYDLVAYVGDNCRMDDRYDSILWNCEKGNNDDRTETDSEWERYCDLWSEEG